MRKMKRRFPWARVILFLFVIFLILGVIWQWRFIGPTIRYGLGNIGIQFEDESFFARLFGGSSGQQPPSPDWTPPWDRGEDKGERDVAVDVDPNALPVTNPGVDNEFIITNDGAMIPIAPDLNVEEFVKDIAASLQGSGGFTYEEWLNRIEIRDDLTNPACKNGCIVIPPWKSLYDDPTLAQDITTPPVPTKPPAPPPPTPRPKATQVPVVPTPASPLPPEVPVVPDDQVGTPTAETPEPPTPIPSPQPTPEPPTPTPSNPTEYANPADLTAGDVVWLSQEYEGLIAVWLWDEGLWGWLDLRDKKDNPGRYWEWRPDVLGGMYVHRALIGTPDFDYAVSNATRAYSSERTITAPKSYHSKPYIDSSEVETGVGLTGKTTPAPIVPKATTAPVVPQATATPDDIDQDATETHVTPELDSDEVETGGGF